MQHTNRSTSLLCEMAIAVIGLMLCSSVWAANKEPDLKIGVINMQKAIQETSAGKAAKKKLEKDYEKKKVEITKMETDIKKLTDDLEKKRGVLSEEVLRQKQAEVQQEMMKYQQVVGKAQVEIQKKERELTKPIVESLQDIVSKIARKGNYTMVLETSEQNVMFAKKEIDLTDQVVAEFEKGRD